MPLKKQNIPVVMHSGVDVEHDPKIVPNGMIKVQNGIFERRGAIVKRDGGSAKLTMTDTDYAMGGHKNTPFVYGDNMRVYDSTSDSFSATTNRAGLAMVDVEKKSKNPAELADALENGGIVSVFSVDDASAVATAGNEILTTYETDTGRTIEESDISPSLYKARCGKLIEVGGNTQFWYINASAADKLYRYDINSSGAIGSPTNLTGVGAISTTAEISVDATTCANGATEHAVFAFINTASDVVVYSVPSGTNWAGKASASITTTAIAVGVFRVQDNFCVVWVHDTGAQYQLWAQILDYNCSSVAAASNLGAFSNSIDPVAVSGVPVGTNDVRCYVSIQEREYSGSTASTHLAPETLYGTLNTSSSSSSLTAYVYGTMWAKPHQTSGSKHIVPIYWQEYELGRPVLGLNQGDNTADLAIGEAADGVSSAGNTFASASVDFQAIGVEVGDILRIKDAVSLDTGDYRVATTGATFTVLPANFNNQSNQYFSIHKAPKPIQATYCWVDDTGAPVAKCLAGLAAYDFKDGCLQDGASYGYLQDPHVADDGRITYACPYFVGEFSDPRVAIARLELNPTDLDLPVEGQDLALIPNSVPYYMDGEDVYDEFIFYPAITLGRDDDGGGALPANSQYAYKMIYEWTDAQGRVHQSLPSVAAYKDYSGYGTAYDMNVSFFRPPFHRVYESPLSASGSSNLKYKLYRTTDGGSIYYLVKEGEFGSGGAVMTTVTDSELDVNITANEILYTQGGVLENVPPPQYKHHCIHKSRHLVVDNEDPNTTIWYSKEFDQGAAVEYSDALQIRLPGSDGEITGIQSFLDKLIVFKKDKIYAVEGDGLSATLTGAQYRRPYLVSPTLGCINSRSIVRVPAGLMFNSHEGICILDNSLNVVNVGRRVKPFTGTVTASIVHPQKSIAIFFHDDNTDALVYSYLYDQWSTFTNWQTQGAVWVNDALWWNENTSGGNGNSRVMKEAVGTFTDVNSSGSAIHYPLLIETGQINLAGIGGYKRVYEILTSGQNIGAHTLKVSLAYDGEPDFDEEHTFDSSTIQDEGGNATYFDIDGFWNGVGGGDANTNTAYTVKCHPAKQKVSAIRIRVEDSQTSGFNEGFSLTALSLLVGLKPEVLKKMTGSRVMTKT